MKGTKAKFQIWGFLATKLMLCFSPGISGLPEYLNILHSPTPFLWEAMREAATSTTGEETKDRPTGICQTWGALKHRSANSTPAPTLRPFKDQ